MAKRRVLLVDDVQLFLEQQKTYFSREEFELLIARNGEDALRIIAEGKPELVFMDLYMPGMNGDECCYRIKSDPELRSIPIIMITAGIDDDDFDRCWQSGCDDIIPKPINRHYFMSIINKYMAEPVRKAPRYIARLRVKHGAGRDTLLTDYSVNLSTGGLFLETAHVLPSGHPLALEFILPNKDATIQCHGKVAWVNHPESIKNPNLPAGMGIQFLDLTFDDMNAIREYIKQEALLSSW